MKKGFLINFKGREKLIYFLKYFLFLILGFTLSKAKILGAVSPLGMCFSAACPAPFFAFAVFGSALGYLTLFLGVDSIRFICCTLGAATVKSFAEKFFKKDTGNFFMPSVCALCSFTTALAIVLNEKISFKTIIFILLEAFLSFIFTFCFSHAFNSMSQKGLSNFSDSSKITFTVSCCAVYISLCSFKIFSFSFARVLGVVLILLCAFCFKEKGGAVSGAAVGISSAIAFSDLSLGAVFPFAGIMSAVFSRFGQFAQVIGFILTVALTAALNPNENTVSLIAESSFGALIFVLIKKDKLNFSNRKRPQIQRTSKTDSDFKERIEKIQNAILSSGKDLRRVLTQLSAIENSQLKEDTKNAELRRTVADSFFTFSDILKEITDEYDFKEDLKIETALIENILNSLGLKAKNYKVTKQNKIRLKIEIELAEILSSQKIDELNRLIDEKFNLEFKISEISETLVFLQKPKYSFSIGFYEETGGDSKFCGDSCKYEINDEDLSYIILSDGMGTGSRAAVDSLMTVTLFENLILSKLSLDTSLKLVNSALIAKSQDETLATLDVLILDPFSGQAILSKAGAAPSFLKHGDNTKTFNPTSLPAGILRNIKFYKEHIFLNENDVFVLLSDGALTGDYSWISEKIQSSNTDCDTLCRDIAKTARELQKNNKKDDLTVISIEVNKN